jgi:hypothetical protein
VSTRCAVISLCAVLAACTPRPVELGFWLTPLSYQSPRIGGPITQQEFARIDQVARAEIAEAFKEFDVTITANRDARFKVGVVPQLRDWGHTASMGNWAGESRAMAGFGGAGAVNFEFVANGAMVFAPEDASRAELIEAIGRGVGRVAIHEFAHQLLPKRPIDGSADNSSYEGNSAAMREGYYGQLHWDIARPWLEARLKRK